MNVVTVTCGYCRQPFTRRRSRSKTEASTAAYDALLRHATTEHRDLIDAAKVQIEGAS